MFFCQILYNQLQCDQKNHKCQKYLWNNLFIVFQLISWLIVLTTFNLKFFYFEPDLSCFAVALNKNLYTTFSPLKMFRQPAISLHATNYLWLTMHWTHLVGKRIQPFQHFNFAMLLNTRYHFEKAAHWSPLLEGC